MYEKTSQIAASPKLEYLFPLNNTEEISLYPRRNPRHVGSLKVCMKLTPQQLFELIAASACMAPNIWATWIVLQYLSSPSKPLDTLAGFCSEELHLRSRAARRFHNRHILHTMIYQTLAGAVSGALSSRSSDHHIYSVCRAPSIFNANDETLANYSSSDYGG